MLVGTPTATSIASARSSGYTATNAALTGGQQRRQPGAQVAGVAVDPIGVDDAAEDGESLGTPVADPDVVAGGRRLPGQPVEGVQRPALTVDLAGQPFPFGRQQRRPALGVGGEQLAHPGHRKVQRPQQPDGGRLRHLAHRVVAVAGLRVDVRRRQQPSAS